MAMGQRPDAMKEEKMAGSGGEEDRGEGESEGGKGEQRTVQVEGWRREGEAGLRHGAVAMADLRDHCH
jgi:hypothetical protein